MPLLLVKLWSVFPRLFIRPPEGAPQAAARGARARLDRGARRRRDLPARDRPRERRAVVPVDLLLPHHPLRDRLGRDRRAGRAHRGEAADHPRRADAPTSTTRRTTGRRRPSPARCRGAGCCARPGWPPASPCSPPRAAPSRCCARSRSSGSAPATGRGASRSTSPPRPPGVTATATSPAYRLTVVVRRPDGVADPRRPAGAARSTTETLPIACVEGWSASGTWTGVRVRDLLDLVDAPAGQRRAGRSRCRSAGPFRRTTLQGNFADDDRTLLALALERRAARRSTTATRPADRAQPARRAADQVGHPARGARHEGCGSLIGAVGVVVGAYGACLLLTRQDLDQLRRRRRSGWSSGVVLHDVVLALGGAGAGASSAPGCCPAPARGPGGGRPRRARVGRRCSPSRCWGGSAPGPTTRPCWTATTWRAGWCSPALVAARHGGGVASYARDAQRAEVTRGPRPRRRRRPDRPRGGRVLPARRTSTRSSRPATARPRCACMRDAAAPTSSCST